GLKDLALTTNGYFLPHRAHSLKEAGLDRITISLDSLKRDVFKQMTGVDVLDRVLEGIAAAKDAGLQPIKINAVIVRGHNEDEVADFAAFAREHDLKMRFIEFMPLDSGHEWNRDDVVSGKEIRARIEERFPLEPIDVFHRRLTEESEKVSKQVNDVLGQIWVIAFFAVMGATPLAILLLGILNFVRDSINRTKIVLQAVGALAIWTFLTFIIVMIFFMT